MSQLKYRLCEAPQVEALIGAYEVLVFPAPVDPQLAISPYCMAYRHDLGVYVKITDIVVKAKRKSVYGGTPIQVEDDYFLHVRFAKQHKLNFLEAANSALNSVANRYGLYPIHWVSNHVTTMAKFPHSDVLHELGDIIDGERGNGPLARQLCTHVIRIGELDAKVEIHEFGWINAVFVFYSNLDVEIWCGRSEAKYEDHYYFAEESDPTKRIRGMEEFKRIASRLDEKLRNGGIENLFKKEEWKLCYCKPRLDHKDIPCFGIGTHDPLGQIELFKEDMKRNFGFQFRY